MYEQKIDVINGMRKAYQRFKHYKEMTKRVTSFFQDELPGYTVAMSTDSINPTRSGKHYEINIWGKGLEYKERVYLSWYDDDEGRVKTWQEGFEKALAYADPSDSSERHEQEKMLHAELTRMEFDVKVKLTLARKLVKDLPIPSCATVRKDAHLWENPSIELTNRFPILFKRD